MKRTIFAAGIAIAAIAGVAAFVVLVRTESGAGMAQIPGGDYLPLYSESDADGAPVGDSVVRLAPFLLDRNAVTEREFAAFVRANPSWRKTNASAPFADSNYLAHWTDDRTPAFPDAPVVNVSWFAARAYCRWRGKRLPSVAQWEYAAMADEHSPTAARDNAAFRDRILIWYSTPAGAHPAAAPSYAFENMHGVRGMHGVIWEWARDFNNALVTGASRSDSSASRNLFCGGGALSASGFDDYAAFMRFAFRASLRGDYALSSLGFRCAMDAADSV